MAAAPGNVARGQEAAASHLIPVMHKSSVRENDIDIVVSNKNTLSGMRNV